MFVCCLSRFNILLDVHDKCYVLLTLKAPFITAADDKSCNVFPNFLPADDSHEISCLIVIFEKAAKS